MRVLSMNQLDMLRELCKDDDFYSQIIDVLEQSNDTVHESQDEVAFYELFRNSPDAMIISSLETGQYIDVNESFVQYTGYQRSELIGRTSLELSVWVDSRTRDRFVAMLRRDGFVENFEAPYKKKDGSIGIGLISSRFITLHNEECLLSITRDITVYKETQRSLTLANERAAIYYDFLTNASHELRTPLTIVKTSLYIAKKTPLEERREEAYDRIDTQVSLLNEMLDSLMLLARIDLGSDLSHESILANSIIDGAIAMVRERAEQKSVQLEIDVDSSLIFQGNNKYLTIALYELFKNAIEHAPEHTSVKIMANRIDTELVIGVQDAGDGIDDEILPHIFDRFYRGDKARSTRGLGLGLSIAHKIAEHYQCEIRFHAPADGGSCFQFVIPHKPLLIN